MAGTPSFGLRSLLGARRRSQGPRDAEAQLVRLYSLAARRLRVLYRQALLDDKPKSAAFYRARHEQVRTILRQLRRSTRPLALEAVLRSYQEGLRVARLIEPGELSAAFTGVHRSAVEVAVNALIGRLDAAVRTVGREADDVFRQAGLRETALGNIMGADTRSTAKAIQERLVENEVAAFVDRRGKRWRLEQYTTMVSRTTTREVQTVATVNGMREQNRDLIEISEHKGSCDICKPFEGNIYSLSGFDERYPLAPSLPPFHPNCRHVAFPSAKRLEDIEAELGIRTG